MLSASSGSVAAQRGSAFEFGKGLVGSAVFGRRDVSSKTLVGAATTRPKCLGTISHSRPNI